MTTRDELKELLKEYEDIITIVTKMGGNKRAITKVGAQVVRDAYALGRKRRDVDWVELNKEAEKLSFDRAKEFNGD